MRLGIRDRLIARVGPGLLRALAATWRYRVEGEERLQEQLAAGERIVLYAWHGRMLPGAPYFHRYRPVIMVSRSRDGELMARVIERLGWRTIRASSSRAGVRGLLEMVRAVRQGAVGGHIVDGPRGPAEAIKPGLLALAQRSGALLVPVYVSAAWCWRAPSWDRMLVPFPGSRVCLRIGEGVRIGADLAPDSLEGLRKQLEERYRTETRRLEASR